MTITVEKLPEVKVSVCVISYNHELYIADCLKSIVEQETNFRFEVIVSDDGSSDKTAEIITEFQRQYPDIISPILHSKNFGVPTKNYFSAHNASKGSYVSHMDGDDLMLPGKLQKQSDFLDQHPDHVVVWHRMSKFKDNQVKELLEIRLGLSDKYTTYDLKDIVSMGCIASHSSTMYRSEVRLTRDSPGDIYDWMFYVEFLAKGSAAILHDYLGGYRYNSVATISTGALATLTKGVLSNHVIEVYRQYPNFRKELFLSTFLRVMINLKNRKNPCLEDFKALMITFSFISPLKLYRHYIKVKCLTCTNMKPLS